MKSFTHQVRLENGTIGEVTTGLKPKELLGRYAMASVEIDGETRQVYGVVEHVYVQEELGL